MTAIVFFIINLLFPIDKGPNLNHFVNIDIFDIYAIMETIRVKEDDHGISAFSGRYPDSGAE